MSALLLVASLVALTFVSGKITFEVAQIARQFGASDKGATACALTAGVVLACGVTAWMWALR